MATNNTLTQLPNFYAPIASQSGAISDVWYRYLSVFRDQVSTGITVIGSTGLRVEGSPVGPGGTLHLTNTGVTSLTVNQPPAGIAVSNNGVPQTLGVTLALSLTDDLLGVESLSTYGLAARTADSTWNTVTIVGTAGNIDVVNGDAIAGNPTIDLASVPDSGTGSLLKISRDAYGRVSGTTAVIASDITSLVDSESVS